MASFSSASLWTKRTRLQRSLLVGGLAYLCFLLIFWLALPPLLKWQLPTQLSALTGGQATLTQVRSNPFKLSLELTGLDLTLTPNSPPFAGFERLAVNLAFWPLFTGTLAFDQIELEGLYGDLERDPQGRFTFQPMLEHMARTAPPATEEPVTQTSAPLPKIAITQFDLRRGQFRFRDHYVSPAADIEVTPINFSLSNFTTSANPGDANRYQIQANLPLGGRFNWRGDFGLQPHLHAAGSIALESVDLTALMPFVRPYVKFELASAKLDLSSDYQFLAQDAQWSLTTNAGALSLSQLALASADPSASVPVRLGQFALSGVQSDLGQQQISIERVTLQDAEVIAALSSSGALDLQDLLTPQVSRAATGPDAATIDDNTAAADRAETPSWQWSVNAIEGQGLNLVLSEPFSGEPLQHQLTLETMTISKLDSSFAEPIQAQINARINQQASLKLDSQTQLSLAPQLDLASTISLNLQQLELAHFQPYVSPHVRLSIDSGKLSGQGSLTLGYHQGTTQLTTDLSVALDELLTQAAQTDFAKAAQLRAAPIRVDLNQRRVSLGEIKLKQPYGRIVIAEDGSTNIGDLVVAPTEPTPSTTTNQANAEPWQIAFDSITIENGSAFFADYSLTPDFATGIHSLNGSLSALDSAKIEPASIELAGKVDKYAPMSLTGSLHPLRPETFLDLALKFNNIELTSMNPYSGTYAGYVIDKGQLSLDLQYQLQDNQLKGSNKVVVDQLQLGAPTHSNKATSLPVALAVALLKDKNGVIDLGLEVSGDVNDPDFAIGPLIATAFGNMISKIVTSPFALLGNLLGAEDELDKIAFEAGTTTLSPEGQHRLDLVAKALDKRPQLKLDVLGQVNRVIDTRQLQQQQLQRQAEKIAGETWQQFDLASLAANKAQLRAFDALILQLDSSWREQQQQQLEKSLSDEERRDENLEQALRERFYTALLSRQTIADDTLELLGQQRAQAVKAYLVEQGKVAPERVFLLKTHLDRSESSLNALLTLKAD